MGLSTVLKAKTRQAKGGGPAGRLRAGGLLPAVFYGPGLETAQSLTLDYKEFKTAFMTSEGNRSLYTLDIEGRGREAALLKDYQVSPLSRKVIHADFYRVDPNQPVTVKVPVVLSGKPAGVEKGGQLQAGLREVTVATLPGQAPAELTLDVSALGLGQSLHLSQVTAPAGLKLVFSTDLPVATVVIPKGVKTEAEVAEAPEAEAAKAAPAKAAPAKKGKK
ncbi:MAG: 50S ribosomal protein L25 [Candidatus Adiutrix sp.]|nr:50S ribosomal protein L25 [Candidatus Adiutrix sp.]